MVVNLKNGQILIEKTKMESKYKEIEVHKAIELGLLEIDSNFKVCRIAELKNNRWNKNKSFKKVKKRMAERDRGQYSQVRITMNGKSIYCSTHRLIWFHYNGKIPKGKQINHINGNKKDNRLCNLEVVTSSENTKHAHRIGLKIQTGEKNHNFKLSNSQVEKIRSVYSLGKVTQSELANQYNVSFQTISKIVRGDRRKEQKGITDDYSHRRTQGNRERNSTTGRFIK